MSEFFLGGVVFTRLGGRTVAGMEIRAFDKDLRSEQMLHDEEPPILTDENGMYRIEYSAARFRRAEKKSADLIVRAYSSDGSVRAESELMMNAPEHAQINLYLNSQSEEGESEYERLVRNLTPLLEGVAPAALTDNDLKFLVRESEEAEALLTIYRLAARLEQETGFATIAFYGFGRVELPLVLVELVANPRDSLEEALRKAMSERFIPTIDEVRISQILDRLTGLRIEFALDVSQQLVGRMVSRYGRVPAAFITVQAQDRDDHDSVLPSTLTDERGFFTLSVQVTKPADGVFNSRRIILKVMADGRRVSLSAPGSDFFQASIEYVFQADAETPEFSVNLPKKVSDIVDTDLISQKLGTVGITLPPSLNGFLEEAGIKTLTDVLRSGGISRLQNLPVGIDTNAIGVLESHADLSRLPTDIITNQKLIERVIDRGGDNNEWRIQRVSDIATLQRHEFVNRYADLLGSPEQPDNLAAAKLHINAVAQTAVLNDAITEIAANRATLQRDKPGDDDLYPDHCCCPDCMSAMGPLAYLTDLAQFALRHIREKTETASREWSLRQLCDYLGQPFSDLAISCNAVDSKVRQVRIAVEVLRASLKRETLTEPQKALYATAIQQHCSRTYGTILKQLGTSLQEIRTVRAISDDSLRKAIADRLGIATVRLDEMFLSEESVDDLRKLNEQNLERIFGFADTSRFPLREVARPELLSWRSDFLEELWFAEVHPNARPNPWYEDSDNRGKGMRPIIDPDVLGDDDFRLPLNTNIAYAIFARRRDQIDMVFSQHRDALASSFADAINATFETPVDLQVLFKQLTEDESSAKASLKKIREELYLSPDAFHRLHELQKEANPGLVDSDKQIEAANILTWSTKAKKFSEWITEESSSENVAAGLWSTRYFWIALEDKNPSRWRATAEARTEWQAALKLRMALPLIDPDVLDVGGGSTSFIVDGSGKALDIYFARRSAIFDQLAAQDAIRQLPELTTDADRLDKLLQTGLRISIAELHEIKKQRDSGKRISGRIDQLGLSRKSFLRLLEIADLTPGGQSLQQIEWSEVDSILVQVWKARQYGLWSDEEAREKITLSPKLFRIVTPPDEGCGPAPIPSAANRVIWPKPIPISQRSPRQLWQGTEEDFRGWQDRLQARIDQLTALKNELTDAGSSAESASLPKFRDALIALVPQPGRQETEPPANYLSRNLMTDFADGGCAVTTRVAHAFASIQVLLTTLRLNKVLELRPNLRLIGVAPFNSAWQWNRSYETWRAAALLRLYPENIAIPSLRPKTHQTADFLELASATARPGNLSPSDAIAIVRNYQDKVQTTASLKLEAFCHVTASVREKSGEDTVVVSIRNVLFMFAQNGGQAYWSFSDDSTAQTAWMSVQIPTDHKIKQVIGATAYRSSLEETWVYLLARTEAEKLVFFKLNLDEWMITLRERSVWDFGGILDLGIEGEFSAAVLQTFSFNTPPQVAYKVGNGVIYVRGFDSRGNGWGTPPVDSIAGAGSIVRFVQTARESDSYSRRRFACVLTQSAAQVVGWYLDVKYKIVDESYRDAESLVGAIYVEPQDTLYLWTQPFPNSAQRLIYAVTPSVSARMSLVGSCSDNPAVIVRGSRALESSETDSMRLCWTLTDGQSYTGTLKPTTVDGRLGAPAISGGQKVVPSNIVPISIMHELGSQDLSNRSKVLVETYALFGFPPAMAKYLDEAYFWVPCQIGLQLHRCGYYIEALNWYRLNYNFIAPINQRRIHPILRRAASAKDTSERIEDWLLDSLNPHLALTLRTDGYARYVIMSILRCLLDYADDEFARDTPDSVANARQIYLLAMDLLDDENLSGSKADCHANTVELRVSNADAAANVKKLRTLETRLRIATTVNEADLLVRDFDLAAESGQSDSKIVRRTLASVLEQDFKQSVARKMALLKNEYLDSVARAAGNAAEQQFESSALIHTGIPLTELVLQHPLWLEGGLDSFPEQNVASDTNRPTTLRELKIDRSILIRLLDLEIQTIHDNEVQRLTSYCVPTNPSPKWLRLRADSNLQKIRACRNIAGLQRELETYSAPTDSTTGLPTIGRDGQLVLTRAGTARPTSYRYSVLIERAKELVKLAIQFESAMLDALKNQSDLEYQLLRAHQDLKLAQAGVRLMDLKLSEVASGVKLSQLQLSRSQFQEQHFAGLLADGLSSIENYVLFELQYASELQDTAATNTMIAAGLSGLTLQVNPGGPLSMQASSLALEAGSIATWASMLSMRASYERRAQEWAYQKNLAEFDVEISTQQIVLAENRLVITGQEREIANIQLEAAESVVNYLSNRFLNAELYQWMAGVLQDVYRYFLQEAASISQLAAQQLAFERQDSPPPFIKSDYWQSTQSAFGDASKGEDRKGLTGSARLTQDIYQLDQYAFESNQRKMQLTRTISLARLDPVAFARFRESGILPFRLPMEMFDRDFPGHYLRLIKRIRISTAALIPVGEGIRATLSSVGPSRVVIGDKDGFQIVTVRRPPESIALTSPINASGLFDLDAQPELLVPFEGMGVDAGWQFQLPKASNPFDFSSIADVIVNVEYTALDSPEYRTQVAASLGQTTSIDVIFSFRNQFADAWYSLHNPVAADSDGPRKRVVNVITNRSDFPPNLSRIRVEHLTVMVVSYQTEKPTSAKVNLQFREQSAGPYVGGVATLLEGIASTRRSSTTWLPLLGRQPIGDWSFTFDESDSVALFDQNEANDLILVVTCTAELPEYP